MVNVKKLTLYGFISMLIGSLAYGSYELYPQVSMRQLEPVKLMQRLGGDKRFLVRGVETTGATAELEIDIILYLTSMLGDAQLSILNLDLEAIHAWLESQPTIAQARLGVGRGGMLQIDVTEKIPRALLYDQGQYHLVDEEGFVLASGVSRDEHPGLFVIAGPGSEANVAEVMTLLSVSEDINHMIRGFVRIGARRWNVILDQGRVVKLPEDNSWEAMNRLKTLDETGRLLSRDLSVIDLRIPERTYVRPNPQSKT